MTQGYYGAELREELERMSRELAELRIRRDKLIRAHPGTLREIAAAAGLTHQGVAYIKAKEEK